MVLEREREREREREKERERNDIFFNNILPSCRCGRKKCIVSLLQKH